MTKAEYLNRLNNALADYPSEYREDIISTFQRHFEEGYLDNYTDEEIIAELGTVEEVLQGISEMGISPKPKNGLGDNLNSLLDTFASSLKESFSNISSFKDIKEQLADEYLELPEGCNHILVDCSSLSMDVKVYSSDHLEYQFFNHRSTSEQPQLNISLKDDILVFRGSGPLGSLASLELGIPAEIRKLFVNSVGSDVEICQLDLENLVVHSASGDIEIENIEAGTIVLRSTSGDIGASNIRCESIEASATSGDIRFKNADGEININTVSGDAKIYDVKGSCISIIAISGDIDYQGSCQQINAKTNSGDIEMEIRDRIHSANAVSLSGDIEIRVDPEGCMIEAATRSGDVSFPRGMDYSVSGHTYRGGNGSSIITVKTNSGDIEIN